MSEQDIYYNALRKAEQDIHNKRLLECDNDFSKKIEVVRHKLKLNMITNKQREEAKSKTKNKELQM